MLLKELTACRGVSGSEGEIRARLKALAEERGGVCTVDRMGNLIARKDGGDASAPHVLLAAHMDEVGLIVTGVRDDGLLRYKPVGGIDPRVMVSKPVLLGDGRVPGVIGAKAIHLQSEADRDRVLDHDQLYIDIGAKAKAEAEKLCPPGTYAVFDSPPESFGEGMVVSRALDDRIGCLTLLSALSHGYRGHMICAFTVQEEVGLRGAKVLGHYLEHDLVIVLETTAANDVGDVPFEKQVCGVKKGVVISHMDATSIAHPRLRSVMESIAASAGIPHQPKRYLSGGNDAGALQRAGEAKPAVVLSVPCRYIHSPASVAAEMDIQAQADLTNAFLDALPTAWAEICK
ncbi:MAG: M42 family peptidase [Firmicutes bacterium]|nr:M42 family peptidase [Bacillota bacterium]